jgi:hypothetical protein
MGAHRTDSPSARGRRRHGRVLLQDGRDTRSAVATHPVNSSQDGANGDGPTISLTPSPTSASRSTLELDYVPHSKPLPTSPQFQAPRIVRRGCATDAVLM